MGTISRFYALSGNIKSSPKSRTSPSLSVADSATQVPTRAFIPSSDSRRNGSFMEEHFSILASHFDEHAISLRGHVDTIHSATGIEGWALDLAQPTERLHLQ